MTVIRRLKAVGGILAVTAVLCSSHVWGEATSKPQSRPARDTRVEQTDIAEELARTKFSHEKVLTYRTIAGDTLVALQLQPNVPAAASRPRDLLVMVDTSASQVGLPLAMARQIVDSVVATAGSNDRLSFWTVNTPKATRDLTKGFQQAGSAAVKRAVEEIHHEVPLGDTDLKNGLTEAIRNFEIKDGRQRVLLFLGDGMSLHNVLDATDRNKLCTSMVDKEIAFFPVPLGRQCDPQTLHGLASGTGGTAVRIIVSDKMVDWDKRFQAALAVPIFYPHSVKFGSEVQEIFPTKLPPLRSDVPTLVVGRVASAEAITCKLEGTCASRDLTLDINEKLAAPEVENFFLIGMVEQWRLAKDTPALYRADRLLAFTFEQNRMARDEFLAQAQWAMAVDNWEAAGLAFQKAKVLDPHDAEAEAGIKVARKLREGKLTKGQMRQLLEKPSEGLKIEKDGAKGIKISREKLMALAQADEKPKPGGGAAAAPAAPAELAPATDPDDLLRQQKQRRAVEEQRLSQIVDDAERQARRILPTDPDGATELLKRTLSTVRDHPDLSRETQQLLGNRLEGVLRFVETNGARIKRAQEEQLRIQAQLANTRDLAQARAAADELTQARMRAFAELMREARFEEAYKQALAISQDQISKGLPVPVAATAGYFTGLAAKHYSEVRELVRIRQDRVLQTLMQVERSHIPFPDEPPVQYPPASVWRALTKERKEKYENSGLTDDDPVTIKKVKELKTKLEKPINLEKGFEPNTQLKDALEFLSDRYDLTILIDTKAFEDDLQVKEIETQPVKLPKMIGVSLGTVLRLLLSQVNGTYILRREFVEVTTGQRQLLEKTIRVYPVADLVIPIPNSVNQAGLQQNIQVLGSTFNAGGAFSGFGGALGGLNFGIGALGGLGALGVGGLGALGIGGLGALGGLGGALGGAGLGGAAGAGGVNGFGGGGLGFQGGAPVNLGNGGGLTGFGGGQLGQFGNLGGQFGLQGGDQSQVLITLIRQVVGTPNDWGALNAFQAPGGGGPANNPDDQPAANPVEAGNLGYYPPARALVVKNTSRIHTSLGGGLLGPRPGAPPAMGGMGALDRPAKDGAFVIAPKARAGEAVAKKTEGQKQPAAEALARRKVAPSDVDAKKVWKDALAKGVTDPGLIIAVADYLVEHKKFDHVAEFLKANLRQGIVARPWVYEALALALRESKASPDEVERAIVSSADLDPQDSRGFLRASHAMADQKRWDRALAFCRQAAQLDPDSPAAFTDALGYAELGRDPVAMAWAAGQLLRRDWTDDNQDLHEKAQGKLRNLAQALERDSRKSDAEQMLDTVGDLRQRDLEVRLHWQGEADLDLEVKEPIGTVCTHQQRQTPGGGVLLGDSLTDRREVYVAAQAFSGEYQITVRRIWGRPLGAKATLEIVQHKGTPRERLTRETVVLDRLTTLSVKLADGRRTATASVPPPDARRRSTVIAIDDGARVLNQLRSLADPTFTPGDTGMRGGVASLGLPTDDRQMIRNVDRKGPEVLAYQTRLDPVVNQSMDMTARAVVSADRSYVRLSLSPVFQTMGRMNDGPLVTNPLLPGAAVPAAR
jgi:hypothetical protein